MENIGWNSKLAVGVPLIDEQHQEWMKRVADLSAAIAANRGVDYVSKTLSFMVEYTEHHFTTEENLMREKGYPDMAEHRKQHESLRKTLADLVRDFDEDGATHELARFTNTFLVNWLTDHIRKLDAKFGAFLKLTP
jgi:hemerythrin